MSDSIIVPGFEIDHLIARGGMASVYLARQKNLDREVALKVMDKNDDPSFAERFLNEGKLIASFHHPNVITIHDLGLLDDGKAFISMEYIDGGDLEERMRRPISEDEAIAILRSLIGCLDYVHERGVVHRDIKPANILFRKDGSLVLTDFGIAKKLDKDTKLTRDGVAVGSPGYMSPEQARAAQVDNRSDIYSVGVIFSEMLLGENVFEADSYIQTSMNHIQMDIPLLDVDYAKYQTLIDRLLAKDPDDRFEDARAVLSYLNYLEQQENAADQEPAPNSRYKPFFSEPAVEDDPDITQPFSIIKQQDVDQARAASDSAEEPSIIDDDPEFKKGPSSLYAEGDNKIFWFFFVLFIAAGVFFFQHVSFQKQVDDLVEQAEEAYKADKLMLPEQESAYYYYQEVLKLDPENQQAKDGMLEIADRYSRLAIGAYNKGDRANAASFIERGLTIDPDNPQLLDLKSRWGM